MTDKEIQECNKLIAEFMINDKGVLITPDCEYMTGNIIKSYDTIMDEEDELDYHSSWDWLMPVVEKIESLKGDNWIVLVTIKHCQCSIKYFHLYKEKRVEFITGCSTKRKAIYKVVVEFIKWYNKNK